MKKMTKKTWLSLAAGVGMSLAAGLIAASAPAWAEKTIMLDKAKFEVLGISTAKPEAADKIWSMGFPSKVIIPNNQIKIITSLYPGMIKTLYVAEGDKVTRGQKLVDIASPAFLEAQQKYLDAVSALAMEKSNFNRDKLLLDEGIISAKRFEMARASLQQAQNTHAQQKQALLAAGLSADMVARLNKSHRMFPALTLTAPYDSTILQQMVRTGERVDEASALYSLGQISPLWLEIHVPLALSRTIAVGGRIKIQNPALEGKIISVGRMIHVADQGVLVRAEVAKGAQLLTPGQFVAVHLEQDFKGSHAFRIPREGVFRDANKTYVFRQRPKGFEALPVTILGEEPETMIVEAPFTASDRIAVGGISTLKGMLQGLGSEE